MLKRMCSGRMDDEYYSLVYDRDTWGIIGVKDNERDKIYPFFQSQEALIQFIQDLNIKEIYRSESYKDIVNSFERNLRESEDRYLELYEKLNNSNSKEEKLVEMKF